MSRYHINGTEFRLVPYCACARLPSKNAANFVYTMDSLPQAESIAAATFEGTKTTEGIEGTEAIFGLDPSNTYRV